MAAPHRRRRRAAPRLPRPAGGGAAGGLPRLYGLPLDPLGRGAPAGDSGREDDGAAPGSASEEGSNRETIVLFSREAAYRSAVGAAGTFDPDGYTTNGISFLYRSDLEDDDLRVLFVHEVVHLLDWRALAGRAPEWLEEGLAQAMALSRIEPSGALHARELGVDVRAVSESIGRGGSRQTIFKISSGYEAIRSVSQELRRGGLPTIQELVASDHAEPVDPSVVPLSYAQRALFVRYLLQGEGGRWRDGFREYLAALARGDDSAPGDLPRVLGTDWEGLEQGFAKWVHGKDLGLDGPRQLPDRVWRRRDRTAGSQAATEESPSSEPPAASPGPEPDPALLARAVDLLGQPPGQPLGPWTLYTDVHDRRLLRSLDRLAGETVDAYADRFGLDPGIGRREGAAAAAREVVILFARSEDYDALLGEGALFGAREVGGSAGAGMAVLHREEREAEEVRVLLIHELVHLLSRRALGDRPPPWLEEGLADALAFSRITPAGHLHADDLGGKTEVSPSVSYQGTRRKIETTVRTTGPRAAINRLVAALDRGALPPLESLTTMSWKTLVDPRWRQVGYAESAMFVRFLLDGENGRFRQGFRSYLQGIAAADDAAGSSAALLAALGTDWATLQPAFSRWVRSQQIAARME